MSKSSITRLFAGAIAAVVVGLTIGIAGVVAALANGAVVIDGSEVVTLNGGPFAWAIAGSHRRLARPGGGHAGRDRLVGRCAAQHVPTR